MVTTVVRIKATHQQARDLIQRLPRILAGREPDPTGLVKQLQLRVGVAALSSIQKDFERKSQGQTGEDGVKWPELSPITLALRRVNTAPKAIQRLQARVAKLPAAQLHRFGRVQMQQLYFLQGYGHAAERQRALGYLERKRRRGLVSRTEYQRLKRVLRGGLKRGEAEKLAFAQAAAQILRDTGVLFNSLSPGVEDQLSGTAQQRFEVGPGWIIVGTTVPYAIYHQSDRPRKKKADGTDRLPRRAFIPEGSQIPVAWWADWIGALRRGLALATFWERFLKG